MNPCLSNLTLLTVLAALVGCQPVASSATSDVAKPEAADPNDVPITEADVDLPVSYPIAVERIAGFRDAIRAAVESGHHGRAHRPLDEADIVLRRLPEIARDSGVPRRSWEQVVVASEDLNELWGEIHTAIDAHQTPDYAARRNAIDDAVERLARVKSQTKVSQRQSPPDEP